MTVTIAGKKKEIAEKTTIAQIIVSENVENPDYVTVTVLSLIHISEPTRH